MLVLPPLSCEGISPFPDAESGCTPKLIRNTTSGPLHPSLGNQEEDDESAGPTVFITRSQIIIKGCTTLIDDKSDTITISPDNVQYIF